MTLSAALRRIVGLLIAVATLFQSQWAIAQDEASVELARRYVTLRPGVLKAPHGAAQMKPEDLRSALSTVSSAVLRQYRKGADWNPNHPEWKRIAQLIEQDALDAVAQLTNAPWLAEFESKISQGFVLGLARNLEQAELKELIKFYSSVPGTQIARVQQRMFDEVIPTIAERQRQLTSGRALPTVDFLQESDVEGRQLVGLFDEWVRIQRAFAEPGPNQDRSGLQAIPFMVLIAFQTHRSQYSDMWQSIPAQDRRAALDWRDSKLAEKEREAIFDVAKELHAQGHFKMIEQKIGALMTSLERKWRALVQGPR